MDPETLIFAFWMVVSTLVLAWAFVNSRRGPKERTTGLLAIRYRPGEQVDEPSGLPAWHRRLRRRRPEYRLRLEPSAPKPQQGKTRRQP